MQTAILMCGFPRSGKTSYTRIYLKEYIRVSIEDIIIMTTHSFNLKLGNFYKKIETVMINDLISKKHNIVVDKTALTRKSRRSVISRVLTAAKDANLPRPYLKLIILETPANVCIERNIATQKVPPGILRQMINSFEDPTEEEGWDEIIRIKEFKLK